MSIQCIRKCHTSTNLCHNYCTDVVYGVVEASGPAKYEGQRSNGIYTVYLLIILLSHHPQLLINYKTPTLSNLVHFVS